MISLKAIHASLTLPHTRVFPNSNARAFSVLCLCKSNGSDDDPQPPQGDTQNQELLAQIAMLQAQKVRLTDFLDERSSYLAQFGEEAKAEFDKIGEEALKGLDEADARVCIYFQLLVQNHITANIESQMLAFEESNELSRLEIQESENRLEEFEDQMEKDQNEGLFFKSLGQQKNKKDSTLDDAKAKEEVQKIEDVSREEINGSKTRKNVYLFLIGLVTFGIVNSLASSSSTDWRKVVVLGAILVALFSQFVYEQNKDNKKDQE